MKNLSPTNKPIKIKRPGLYSLARVHKPGCFIQTPLRASARGVYLFQNSLDGDTKPNQLKESIQGAKLIELGRGGSCQYRDKVTLKFNSNERHRAIYGAFFLVK